MNKDLMNSMAFLLANSLASGDSGYSNMNIINDQEVNECLMDMYFYIMYSGINEEKQEEYFQEFGKKYKNLNEKQQELVKKEYIDIIETQNKNREKIKRKGMIDYE